MAVWFASVVPRSLQHIETRHKCLIVCILRISERHYANQEERKPATRYLPLRGGVLDHALVFVSVNETLRTLFTPEIRLARALGGRMGLASREASTMNPITASTAQIAALFFMPVTGSST